MAQAIITRFFIIYCPSRVGTKNFCQVSVVLKTRGPKVVIMCIKSRGITTLSSPLMRKSIPIRHSNSPKSIKNRSKDIKGIVFSKRDLTTSLAGESPKTFKSPNQKKTTNIPILAEGSATFLKKCIALISKSLIFINSF